MNILTLANNKSTAVLLMNTGSPDSPKVTDVAKYLATFLGNRRIIHLPWLGRKILVNGIIVPFRSWGSAARYRDLWKLYNGAFPLVAYGKATQALLEKALNGEAGVFLGMAFGKPTIKEAINAIIEQGFSNLILLPLFPHYASSSTGVVLEMCMEHLRKKTFIPNIHIITGFYTHPLFIDAFAERIRTYQPEDYDLLLFTYHGLPLNHADSKGYAIACKETTELLAKQLNLPSEKYQTAFQSQLSEKWLSPFANKVIAEKAQNGIKKLLIVAPSFVADCLETTTELGEEYKELFLNNGGERYELVSSLNDSPLWIKALSQIIKNR